MKRIHWLTMLFMLLITFTIASCSDKEETPGISGQKWSENQTFTLPAGGKITVTFTASSKWVAKSGADWCIVSPSSGEAGEITLDVYAANSTKSTRTANVIVRVEGSSSGSTFQVKQNAGDGYTEDSSINTKVDKLLKENYLWNDEYKTLNPDFSLSYDKFLTNSLMSMTTNTLDKRPYIGNDGKTYYSLFSYILKKNNITSTRSTNIVPKEKEYNFGITGVMAVQYTEEGDVFFEIQGVYKGSSAEAQGLKRGSQIFYIDNQKITLNNFSTKGYALISPSSSQSLKVAGKDQKAVTISSAPIFVNPVILTKVISKGAHRIGYMVYSGFDAGFDEELFAAFKEFKNQGITDLILDLRYNGGGHVMSADLISSCVAGDACKDKIFVQYRYNKERAKKYPNGLDTRKFSYNSYENLNKTSLAAGGLNLNRLYCIVSEHSASSSELVINALKGIDIQVTLIGETTHGKNVGMETTNIIEGKNTYEFAPITFQSYNAKGFGAYENGFKPDYEIDEDDVDKNGSFDKYIEYASDSEPLFSKAISLITGVQPAALKTQRSTRSISAMKALTIPANPKRNGMIKLSESN